MNKWKGLSIVFAVLTIGAVQETFRILTSNEAGIASDRTGLSIMAVGITIAIAVLAIVFWFKSYKK